MAVYRGLPSRTLEEIMAEVSLGEPVDPTLVGSAQVLPVVGESAADGAADIAADLAADLDEPWVVITPEPSE